MNDELSTRLSKAKEDVVAKFKSSKVYTDVLDRNYVAGFKDFRMDAIENFLEVDFSSIKLNLAAATSSLIQTGSDDVNIKDDATTQLPLDDPKVNAPPSWRRYFYNNPCISFPFIWFLFGPLFWDLFM